MRRPLLGGTGSYLSWMPTAAVLRGALTLVMSRPCFSFGSLRLLWLELRTAWELNCPRKSGQVAGAAQGTARLESSVARCFSGRARNMCGLGNRDLQPTGGCQMSGPPAAESWAVAVAGPVAAPFVHFDFCQLPCVLLQSRC
ncbi:uncharacterized protein IWZ02DRAFT_9072 [Phyllosticta citriasiana]|uniref:uncharacterized protein n=1 Tax=Phyllosticta citriasiana TaxID=595635 RepID=UPI0030FD2C9D